MLCMCEQQLTRGLIARVVACGACVRAALQLAHQWKGTCSYISAKAAQRASLRLEQSAKAFAKAKDSEYLEKEVVAALYDLQVELRTLTPAVHAAIEQL